MKLSTFGRPAFAGALLVLFSLSIHAAPVTYKFTGEVTYQSFESYGTLYAPEGTEVEGSFTYDPEAWVQTCECSGGVSYHSDGVNHGFNLAVGDLYESLAPLPDDLHSIDIGGISVNRWNYARRIRDFGDPYYNKAIVFINILEGSTALPGFPTDIFDPLMLPSGATHNGRMIDYADYDQSVEVGEVAFTITSLSLVPIPAAAWLFGSALLGLIGLKRRR